MVPGSNVLGGSFDDLEIEGLMYDNYAVWRPDFVNPQHSYESKFDATRNTSS